MLKVLLVKITDKLTSKLNALSDIKPDPSIQRNNFKLISNDRKKQNINKYALI